MKQEQTLFKKLYGDLRTAITVGHLLPEVKMPGTRTLSKERGVSRNTVLAVYEQLVAEGYLRTVTGVGTFVCDGVGSSSQVNAKKADKQFTPEFSQRSAKVESLLDAEREGSGRDTGVYDFRYGSVVCDQRSLQQWKKIMRAHMERSLLSYHPSEGIPELRTAIASYLSRRRGMLVSAEDILITSGTHQALNLIADGFLDRGDSVVMEDPHYVRARNTFLYRGAQIVATPVIQDGLNPDYLEKETAKLAYVTPSHQFPTGQTMSVRNRKALLSWADKQNCFVIEDDYDSEFRFSGKPLETLWSLDQSGRVIYVGTFSKSLFPSLRLGFIVAQPEIRKQLAQIKEVVDPGNSALEQYTLATFIDRGLYELHIRRHSRIYGEKRLVFIQSLKAVFGDEIEIVGSDAGMHVVLKFNGLDKLGFSVFLEECKQMGLGVYPLSPYYLKPKPINGVLLGYASLPLNQIRKAAGMMHRAYKNSQLCTS